MTQTELLTIINGPEKKQLWQQSPQIDEWHTMRSDTQMAIKFTIGTKFSSSAFLIYLQKLETIKNDPDTVLFCGHTIDQINGHRRFVSGQYNFVEKKGIAEVAKDQDVDC